MFILEECFHREPEFREFAAAIKPSVETPTRKILKIEVRYDRVNITAGESEVLWPLIERWEETGHQRDLDALEVAMERLWRARQEELEIEADSISEVESKTEL